MVGVPLSVYLVGMHLIGVCLIGVYLMGVCLIGVYLMGVHLIGATSWTYISWTCTSWACTYLTGRTPLRHTPRWVYTSWACTSLGIHIISVHLIDVVQGRFHCYDCADLLGVAGEGSLRIVHLMGIMYIFRLFFFSDRLMYMSTILRLAYTSH